MTTFIVDCDDDRHGDNAVVIVVDDSDNYTDGYGDDDDDNDDDGDEFDVAYIMVIVRGVTAVESEEGPAEGDAFNATTQKSSL